MTGLDRNVGGIDRLARGVLAVLLAGIGIWALTVNQWTLGLLALLASGGLTFNVVTGFCGINAVLGVDTCSWDGAETAEK